MRNLLILLSFLYSTTARSADGLGRLFFSPTQRAQLDTVRAQRDRRLPITIETEAAPPVAVAPPPLPQGPDVVTYNGVVQRSDGKSTVWINGKPINERERRKPAHEVSVLNVQRDGAVSVAIPQAERRAALKVGQSMDVTSGTIEESYARRVTRLRTPEKTSNAAIPTLPTAGSSPPVPSAPQTAVSATSAKSDSRSARAIETKEADPDSGAAPAVPRIVQK